MSTNAMLALLVVVMVNAVVFGAGAVAVLAIPSLSAKAGTLLPAVVVASFMISPFIAWPIARNMRERPISQRR